MKQPNNSLNIFIFYSIPSPNYLKYLTQFVNISMNSDLLIYSVDNKGELGQLSIITKLILDLTSNHNEYLSVFVYIENISILNNTMFQDKNWYNIFECIKTKNIVMVYKETLLFKKPLFIYNVSCNEKELIIQYTQTDNILLNNYFIYDNITINEYFDLVIRVHNKIQIFDILIERRPILDNNIYTSYLYTNIQPINSIVLLKNSNIFQDINQQFNSILNICKNNVNIPLLKNINTKMFQLNKKKILEYISLK